MRKTEAKLILAAAVAASAMMFAACGGSAQETTAAETTAAETTAAQAGTEAPAKPESLGTVKLGNYKGIELEDRKIDVTDEEVNSYIDSVLKNASSATEVDRPAENGDTVNIDYVGKKDGVAFDGGTASGYDLVLGSNSFIDGFEDGLIGAKKGEKLTLNLTFPEQYHSEELAGQAVTFDVTVNAVKEPKEQALTDEWVSEYTGGAQKTVAEYQAEIKKELTEQYKNSAYTADVTNAIQAAIESSEFSLDPAALEYETKVQTDHAMGYLQQYGIDLASYLSMTGMTQEDYDAQMKATAEESLKTQLVVQEIAKQEGLEVAGADYKKLEELTGYSKDLLVQYYGQEQVDSDAQYLKVADFLISNAVRVEAPAEETTEAAAEETAEASAEENAEASAEETTEVSAEETAEESSAAN